MSAAPSIMPEAHARALFGHEAVEMAARHAQWRMGDLSYLMHEGQIEALERINATRHRRFVINVGRRWGKSRLFVILACMLCVLRALYRRGATPEQLERVAPDWLVRAACRTKSKARVLYAAPTADMIREFVMPHMDLMIDHAPRELCPELTAGDYVFPDGDRIVMRGCEDRVKANRLRGPEADLAFVDEGGFISILGYVVKSVIGFQLAETRGRLLMSSTPPESPDHPWVDFVAEAEERGAYYHASTEDAPHLTEEMIAELIEDAGGRESVTWQREGLALLVRDPEIVVLPEFTDALVRAWPRPEHFHPHIIGDLGFVDMTVMLFGYYDFAADMAVIEAEVAGSRLLSADLDDEVRRTAMRLWGDKPVHRRRADSTARERADLSREEWQGDEGEGESWQAVSRDGGRTQGRLRALANRTRIRCKNGRIAINPECKVTIAHAKHARWNASRSELARVTDENGQPLHHYDGCAALLYFDRDLDRSSNPYPKLPPGVSEATHYIPPHLRVDSKKAAMRRIFRKARA